MIEQTENLDICHMHTISTSIPFAPINMARSKGSQKKTAQKSNAEEVWKLLRELRNRLCENNLS